MTDSNTPETVTSISSSMADNTSTETVTSPSSSMADNNSTETVNDIFTSSGLTDVKPENNETIQISDEYYLIIGFEVNHYNNPKAYNIETNTQNLDVENGGDYGHAFFFTVFNGEIFTVLSFGPAGTAEPNKVEAAAGIDSYTGRRPGTTNYTITEISKLFKFKINKSQLNKIKTHSDKFIKKVKSGDEKYTVYTNDTCAETAKDILDDAEIDTPNGKGYINTPSGAANFLTSGIKFVNPYSWYDQFIEKYGPATTYLHEGVKSD